MDTQATPGLQVPVGDTGRAGEGKKGLSVGVPPPALEQIGSDQIYARDSFLKPCIIQD